MQKPDYSLEKMSFAIQFCTELPEELQPYDNQELVRFL